MRRPSSPPLNGRNIAEFYIASEATKRTKLRAYAKPPEEQAARVIMYDLLRRSLPEYFGKGRDEDVLARLGMMFGKRQFSNAEYDATWHKSNRAAVQHLRELDLHGHFENVRTRRVQIDVRRLRVHSTVDFYATFIPDMSRSKPRSVAVIINPSGMKAATTEKRKVWATIEAEIAWRAAHEQGFEIDEVMYIDLPKHEIYRHKGPKVRIWDEIDATCERIVRDWREIRLEQGLEEDESA